MPLGSALKSTIDIDFTRAQGINSSGQITFEPPRVRIGTTIVSNYKVVVPVSAGVATVDLVRLPAGTYHVKEELDGRAPYEFNFALPTSAAGTIQYEDIAHVDTVPLVYTVVRTINNVAPNPTTGNIVVDVSGGGATNLDGLTDVAIASPANGQSLVYDGIDSRWENRYLTAGDVGASPSTHIHSSSQITDFQTSVDARIQLIVDAAPSALDTLNELAAALGDDPDFAGTVTLGLAGKQPLDSDLTTIAGLTPSNNDILQRISGAWANRTPAQLKSSLSFSKVDVGLSNVDDTSDLNKPLSTLAIAAIEQRALPDRILRVKDRTKQGVGTTYNLPNTSNAWVLFAAGPTEYTIQASVGDDISLEYDFLMDIHASAAFDFAVVTGGTPTIQRYLSSGDSSPSSDGPSGTYPSDVRFQGMKGSSGFTVVSGDLDSGFIRLRWAIKTSVDTARIFADNNYPLSIRVINIRLSGL
jgi:hypothetical protein